MHGKTFYFPPVHLLSTCRLAFQLYTCFPPVHLLSTCTLAFQLYTCFPPVHLLSSCTLAFLLYTCFPPVHLLSSCTLAFLLYTCFPPVHLLSNCTLAFHLSHSVPHFPSKFECSFPRLFNWGKIPAHNNLVEKRWANSQIFESLSWSKTKYELSRDYEGSVQLYHSIWYSCSSNSCLA